MTQATQEPSNPLAPASRVSPFWRSLDELQNTEQFQEFLAREFPQAASEFPEGVSRRRWMQLMSASFALAGAAGCRWETEKIAEFANRPEGYIPGTHQHYATNIHWAGAPRHLLVTKYDERPVKVEGNPDHPASLGAADGFTQAATLALYDPDRARSVIQRDGSATFTKDWTAFENFLDERVAELGDGAGLAILTPTIDSYAFYAALDSVQEKFPAAKFYKHDAISCENALAGAELAFGSRLRSHYKLTDAEGKPVAKVIATFDADLLHETPDASRIAREYADGRDPDGEMNRLWSVESFFTKTGAAADHRLPVKSSAIGALLVKLRDKVQELTAGDHEHGEPIEGEPTPEQFLDVLADDLAQNQGSSLVVVGPGQPAAVHALGHEINSLLGNLGKTVTFTEEPKPRVEVADAAALLEALGNESVNTLVVLDGNPAYDLPGFAAAIEKAPHTIRLGAYDDETSRVCHWSLPQTHPFEEWGDVIAWDGSVGVCQPMIEPLLGGRSVVELLAVLAGDKAPNAQQMVRDAVTAEVDLDEAAWNKVLHDGLAADSAAEAAEVGEANAAPEIAAPAEGDDAIEIVFVPSSSTYDGRLANSGWLQETPDFLTKLTWDNAALVAPATAKKLGLKQGKLATIKVGETSITAPVYVMPGQAKGSISIALGYGRTAAGRVGGLLDPQTGRPADGLYPEGIGGTWFPAAADPVGVDVYPLRAAAKGGAATTGFIAEGVTIKSTGKDYLLVGTQDHHAIDALGLEAIGKRTGELIRTASQDFYTEHKDFAPSMSHEVMVHAGGENRPTEPLWDLQKYHTGDPNYAPAWGMTIDLNKCIGCNACMVACQAENNVPVVGKDQVHKGREMHWIRIDRYFRGTANPQDAADPANFDNPQIAHQPIACQHCETAPCEEVCPVAATVHDNEGLNVMVYNRCIGTRYCSNNCPYKVRRFNYFRYTKKLYEASNELMKLVMNPEVTVRSRGVMEKCTFCVQRISAARITAKNEGRPIRDGDVTTACQQACSTRAIEFGDLRDEKSRVHQTFKSDRAYGILTELMTNPRNKFLAKIRNPHPMLARPDLDPVLHHHGEGHGEEHGHEEHKEESHA